MKVALRVQITGPLTRFFEGFAAELAARGYTDLSLANQLRLMADLSRWLEAAEITVDRIDHAVLKRFLEKRRRTHAQFITERGLRPLLSYFEAEGVVTIARPAQGPRCEVLRAYERYLVEERAIGAAPQALYLSVAEAFLGRRDPRTLTAADVTRFAEVHARQPAYRHRLTALRSVLRFLFVSSRTPTELMYAVPSAPRWTQRSLPQPLEPDELAAVMATCDRRTLVGCRDHAVLLLLVRLGLRAGEVAALRLEDIDWHAGELHIHGKGRSLHRLPLPVDVGQALAAYLRRAQRDRSTRSVFVRCRAPFTEMTSPGIVAIATQALRAAGITRGGAHRLRHTAATQMLRRGASLTEIAQVLRHRHVDTTAIYAKVDHGSLSMLAWPWPSDRPGRDRVCALAQPWPGGVA
jgi:integrase/recombinase XerD